MAAPKRKFQQTYIREWRKHRGLTLEKVADRLDMTPSHISMLRLGGAQCECVSSASMFESHYADSTRGWGSRSARVGISACCRKGASARACRSRSRSKTPASSELALQRVRARRALS
jgi:helix-turn-helix protein